MTKLCAWCGTRKERSAFCVSNKAKGYLDTYCKVCRAERRRSSRKKNPDKARSDDRRNRIKTYFGITELQYDTLRGQADRCAICGVRDKDLYLDHNHSTGTIREFLCHYCNTALGLLNEDPERMERMIAYVRKHERRVFE